MANGNTPIAMCTVPEIIQHLAERVPSMAVGVLAPEDGQVCSTLTLTSGNRCAALGLIELLKAQTIKNLVDSQQDMAIEEDNDESKYE